MRYLHSTPIKSPLLLPMREFERKAYPSFQKALPEHTDYRHFYRAPNNELFPSVSEMLNKTAPASEKEGLDNWRAKEGAQVADHISKETRDEGTMTHDAMDRYLNNQPIGHLPLTVRAHFMQLADLVQDVEYVYATEIPLYSYSMKLGGTCDGVGVIDGLNTIFDYKTKRSVQKESYLERYYLQMTAYGTMWTELTGMKIQQIVLFISSKPGFSQVFVRNPEDFEDKLCERLKQFHSAEDPMNKCKHGTPITDECTRCHINNDLLLQQSEEETIN